MLPRILSLASLSLPAAFLPGSEPLGESSSGVVSPGKDLLPLSCGDFAVLSPDSPLSPGPFPLPSLVKDRLPLSLGDFGSLFPPDLLPERPGLFGMGVVIISALLTSPISGVLGPRRGVDMSGMSTPGSPPSPGLGRSTSPLCGSSARPRGATSSTGSPSTTRAR